MEGNIFVLKYCLKVSTMNEKIGTIFCRINWMARRFMQDLISFLTASILDLTNATKLILYCFRLYIYQYTILRIIVDYFNDI